MRESLEQHAEEGRREARPQGFPRYHHLSRSPCLLHFFINGGLGCHNGDGNENVKKAIGWIGKTTTLHHAFFVYFFTVTVPLRREKASFHVLWRMLTSHDEISFLSLNVDIVVSKSAPEEFGCIWQSNWSGKIAIEIERRQIRFLCDIFVPFAVVLS